MLPASLIYLQILKIAGNFNPYPAGTESELCLSHQYRAKPACTSMQSDQFTTSTSDTLYLVIISLKMIIKSSKKGKVDYSILEIQQVKGLMKMTW